MTVLHYVNFIHSFKALFSEGTETVRSFLLVEWTIKAAVLLPLSQLGEQRP